MNIWKVAGLACFTVFCGACSFGPRVECNSSTAPAVSLKEFSDKLNPEKRQALESKISDLVLQKTMGNLGSIAGMAMSGDRAGMREQLQKDLFRDFCGKSYEQIMEM